MVKVFMQEKVGSKLAWDIRKVISMGAKIKKCGCVYEHDRVKTLRGLCRNKFWAVPVLSSEVTVQVE
jgi:hypothetical protein